MGKNSALGNAIMGAFTTHEDVRKFLVMLIEDATDDLHKYKNEGAFVPSVLDVYANAKGLYGVNVYRFFLTLAKFISGEDKGVYRSFKDTLVSAKANSDVYRLQAHILNDFDVYFDIVSRDKMPSKMVNSTTVYKSVDEGYSVVSLIFFRKLSLKNDWNVEQYFADYFRVAETVFGDVSRFKQVAFGKENCDEYFRNIGLDQRRLLLSE